MTYKIDFTEFDGWHIIINNDEIVHCSNLQEAQLIVWELDNTDSFFKLDASQLQECTGLSEEDYKLIDSLLG